MRISDQDTEEMETDPARLRDDAVRLRRGASRADRVSLGLVAGASVVEWFNERRARPGAWVRLACAAATLIGLGSLVVAWRKEYTADELESRSDLFEHMPVAAPPVAGKAQLGWANRERSRTALRSAVPDNRL